MYNTLFDNFVWLSLSQGEHCNEILAEGANILAKAKTFSRKQKDFFINFFTDISYSRSFFLSNILFWLT